MKPTAPVRLLLLTLMSLLIAACAGGGSTGTGLGVNAAGSITDTDGTPLVGALVTARTTLSDDQEISDDDGRYELDLELEPGGTIEFTFDAPERGIHWVRVIDGIPEATKSFTVSWEVTSDLRVTPVATVFFDEDGNQITG